MSLITKHPYEIKNPLIYSNNKFKSKIGFNPKNNIWNTKRHLKNENEIFKIFSTLEIEKEIKISEDNIKNYKGKKAIIIGAGPSGATTAAYLAENGFQVKVYERLNDPNKAINKQKRSIPNLLWKETIEILENLEIDLPGIYSGYKNGLHRYFGTGIIKPERTITISRVEKEKRNEYVIGSRFNIARVIILKVIEKYTNVEFNFNCECESIDFDKQIARFKNGNNEIIEEAYDLLIGSDGKNSRVREELKKHDKKFKVKIKQSNEVYCTIYDLDASDEKYSKIIIHGFLYYFVPKEIKLNGGKIKPRIIMYPKDNGKWDILFAFPKDQMKYLKGNEKEWFTHSLKDTFPKSIADNFIKKLSEAEMYNLGTVIRTSQFIGPKTILTGDAVHAVTPTLGLGSNMAITDAKYINIVLKKEKDLDKALLTYNKLRYHVVQNTQDLEESIYPSIVNKTFMGNLLLFYGNVHIKVHNFGNKLLPNFVPSPVYRRFIRNMISTTNAINFIKIEGTVISFLIITSFLIIVKSLILNNVF